MLRAQGGGHSRLLSHQDSCWSGGKAGTAKERSVKDAPLQDGLQKHALEKAAGSWVGPGQTGLSRESEGSGVCEEGRKGGVEHLGGL